MTEESSEHGKKVKAGKLLSQFLREISQEKTEMVKDPETGEDRMGTKAEALVRNMWKMALGYTEQRVVGDDLKDFSFSPDKGMMSRIFDRIEGKVPMTATIDKQKATAAERLTKENTKRLNKVGGFGATADANREI